MRQARTLAAVAAAALGLSALQARSGTGANGRAQAEPMATTVQVPDAAQHRGELRILFADVEGGQATLFVTPGGESLLVDTGWPGNGGRDADRIVALARRAGLRRIDDVLLTHFHTDHAGGVPDLVARIPVRRFLDHGNNTEFNDPATVKAWNAYTATVRSRHIPRQTVKIGGLLPFGKPGGIRAEVVSSNGGVLETPLPGTGQGNPACARSPERALEGSENDKSVGFMLTWGKLRVLDLGDLTWAMERGLVCPVDKLGPVDLWVVSHHGMGRSSSPALVSAIRPTVAVMDNGPRKGGEVQTFETLADPRNGVGVLWQLHASEGVQASLNTVQERMANRAGEDGNWLEADARPDGSLTVTNGRTGEVVRYPARQAPASN